MSVCAKPNLSWRAKNVTDVVHSFPSLSSPLQIKYKEEYEKSKGKAAANSDSRLLHSMQVGKLSSEVAELSQFLHKVHYIRPVTLIHCFWLRCRYPTRKASRRVKLSSTYRWTWSTSLMPRRPSRLLANWIIALSYMNTPFLLRTWKWNGPRKLMTYKVRWDMCLVNYYSKI